MATPTAERMAALAADFLNRWRRRFLTTHDVDHAERWASDDVNGCDVATNQFGDAYTGCNWQSVDLHYFSVNGPFVIAVDALDAGGAGGWVGTAIVNGVEYPTNSAWRCQSPASRSTVAIFTLTVSPVTVHRTWGGGRMLLPVLTTRAKAQPV